MTTLVMNTIVNPFRGLGKSLWTFCEVAGYARAASELARQGLYKESKACMMQVQALRDGK
jgi:hypothetical protein